MITPFASQGKKICDHFFPVASQTASASPKKLPCLRFVNIGSFEISREKRQTQFAFNYKVPHC